MDLGPVDELRSDADARPVAVLDPERAEHREAIRTARVLALDLESDNYHRYFEKTCLVQLSTPDDDWFFDPLRHGIPGWLREELGRGDRAVVAHAADNDVRALARDYGVRIGRIFDTSIAARVLGMPGLGLKTLLEAEFGVVVDKGEQRSDWSQRPLGVEQLRYAREDVRWLTRLAEILADRLTDIGRLSWHEEECERIRCLDPTPKRFDVQGWRRVKQAKGLGPRGRAVMAQLWQWREDLAASLDRPPFRVLRSDQVARLAKVAEARGQGVLRDLSEFRFLPSNMDRASLREAVAAGLEAPDPGARPPRPTPPPEVRPPLDEEALALRSRLRALRDQYSGKLGIDPGFLLANQVIDRLAREAPRDLASLEGVEGVGGWRTVVLGQEIVNAVCL